MKKITKNIFVLAALLCASGTCFGALEADSRQSLYNLKEGSELLAKGRYSDAIDKLKAAHKELPVMSDYILFFLAEAYAETKKFTDSDSCLAELLESHPDSPLKKKARALQIRNAMQDCRSVQASGISTDNAGDNMAENACSLAFKYAEQYVSDYPDNAEMTFLYASLLKEKGSANRANKLFRQIYAANTPYSEAAHEKLQPSDITIADLLTKASNFIKTYEYNKAESILSAALPIARGSLKNEAQKKLGIALFRQKKYKEAADEFLKAGDIYNTARAQYRAGELEAFKTTVAKMASAEDKRAGSLLIALASKKRRQGKPEEALEIYNNVKKQYPSLDEEALWGIAWTYYRSGDYNAAGSVLTELNARYYSSMYLYWKARCVENADAAESVSGKEESAASIYKKAKTSTDFYSLLSHLKDKNDETYPHNILDVPADLSMSNNELIAAAAAPQQSSHLAAPHITPDVARAAERSDILLSLGMKEDAFSELTRASRLTSNPHVLAYLAYKLQEAGAYKRAITLISQVANQKNASHKLETDINYMLYPLAYWSVVRDISDKYGVSPFILLSVMREESRFDPDATSVAGAVGLMQIMPETAHRLAVYKINTAGKPKIREVKTNITIGAYYLHFLLKEFGSFPVALAAYNAGPDKVKEWLKEGNYKAHDEFIEDIPYDETRNYVKRVLLTYSAYLGMTGQ